MSSTGGLPMAVASIARAPLSPCRVDSCIYDPQIELLVSYREQNLRSFVDTLSEESVDVNKEYVEENFKTILYLAVEEGKIEYVREILRRKDVNPNLPNKVLNKQPLHLSAEKGLDGITKLLLDCGADVNAKMENGFTALHLASLRSSANWASGAEKEELQKKFVIIVNFLLGEANINFDAENNIGCTPLYYAAEKGTAEVVKCLLKKGACITVEVDDETAEEHIEKRMPNVLKEIDTSKNRQSNDKVENKLFKALYDEFSEKGKFMRMFDIEAAKNAKIDLNADDGGHTFLQKCCDMGYHEIVDFLLTKGADPNHVGVNNKLPPVVWAAHHGYYKVIRVFKKKFTDHGVPVDFSASDNNIKNENVLHKILKAESKAVINQDLRNYTECLKLLLLDDSPSYRNNIAAAINGQDNLGNTPLHVAAQHGNHEAVRKLLRYEANIGLKNYKGETPIAHIAPGIMEEYLDECLDGEGLTTDDEFKITFKYSFLGPPIMRVTDIDKDDHHIGLQTLMGRKEPLLGNQEPTIQLPEAEPLWYMSQIKEHRYLLNHPTITSFLCLKWRRIRPVFYTNLGFYLAFLILITSYILFINEDINNSKQVKLGVQNTSESKESPPQPERDYVVLTSLTVIFLGIITARELFQMLVSFRRYIFNLENILEIIMIVLTFILFFYKADDHVVKHISGVIILLSWTEFVLLVGKHPSLSTYIEMFGKVSRNFVRSLSLYIIFIISFGLCFFVILHRPKAVEGEEDVNPYFFSTSKSLMKTIVMSLTGELEFEDIEFSSHVGRIIFVIYVFFIMLVLVNLLNGLAVSDISEIQKHAEISCHVSRVEQISHIESLLLGDPFHFLTNFPSFKFAQKLPSCNFFSKIECLQNIFSVFGSKRFLLFAERLKNKRAIFYPNKSCNEKNNQDLKLSEDILKAAKGLIIKKQASTEAEEMKSKLDSIDRTLKLLAEQQNYVLSMLNSIKN